jgi:hypothetical protein
MMWSVPSILFRSRKAGTKEEPLTNTEVEMKQDRLPAVNAETNE